MFFKKDIIQILTNENRRLKRETQRLRQSLSELDKYKEEYQTLIAQLENLKKEYSKKSETFSSLENAYKKELHRITNGGMTGR